MSEKEQVYLTRLTSRGGWAAKWGPGDLEDILDPIMAGTNDASPFRDRLLVGLETSDDAAVLITGSQATVLTVDILTPLVDDPYDFGRIAAANALSDIYAMGAIPVCALNVLAIDCKLGASVAKEILAGGAKVVSEAGALIVGGHSVDDEEPKYGLCVMGTADPNSIVRNFGAEPGDVLYLTKPLGTGVLSSAYKVGEIDLAEFQCAIDSMTTLNAAASKAMMEVGVHAATDVTGFGLAGHLREMLMASRVSAIIDWEALPLFPKVLELSQAFCRPSRTFTLMDFVGPQVKRGTLEETEFDDRMAIICDPQTSGGLLIALAADKAEPFEAAFERIAGTKPYRIGHITDDPSCSIAFADA